MDDLSLMISRKNCMGKEQGDEHINPCFCHKFGMFLPVWTTRLAAAQAALGK